MGTLYALPPPVPHSQSELPTVDALSLPDRVDVELARISGILARLSAALATVGRRLPADASSLVKVWSPLSGPAATTNEITTTTAALNERYSALRRAVFHLHVQLLEGLAAGPGGLDGAYELGLWLQHTAHPSQLSDGDGTVSASDVLCRALSRERVTGIQRRLRTYAADLPDDSAAVVSQSLGKWAGFFATVVDGGARALRSPGDPEEVAREMTAFLAPQGDLWLRVLSGEERTDGLLSAESEAAGAEAALHRARRLVAKVAWHYAPALAVLLAALGGIVFLAQADLGGAGRVWTEIAAIASALGVSTRGIGAATGRLVREGTAPLVRSADVDAKAYAVTTLPGVRLRPRAVGRLRRSGIGPSSRLGRS